MAVTLAQVRRDAADLLGDLLVLRATYPSDGTVYYDGINLKRTAGSMDNWIGVVGESMNPANNAYEVLLTGPNPATASVTLTPVLPAAVAIGDTMDVIFHRGTGWRRNDYRRAANRAIRTVQANHAAEAVGAPTAFDPVTGSIPIPAAWRGVYGVEIQGGDGLWRSLGPADWDVRGGEGVVAVLPDAPWGAVGRNVRLLGVTDPPELVGDLDTTSVDPDYLVNAMAADLMMSGSHRQIDRESEGRAMLFEQRSNQRLAKARRRPPSNLRLVR